MAGYRLEACQACGDVRLRYAITRRGQLTHVGGAEVWVLDLCDSCHRGYEASITPPGDPEPGAAMEETE